jgi:hypothetical protein
MTAKTIVLHVTAGMATNRLGPRLKKRGSESLHFCKGPARRLKSHCG